MLFLRIQGSAVVTLGISFGDVGAWLFIAWLCIDLFFNLEVHMGKILNATFKTGMDVLTALRGQVGKEQPRLSTRRRKGIQRPCRKPVKAVRVGYPAPFEAPA